MAKRDVNRSLRERIDLIMPSVEYRQMVDHEDREAVYRLRDTGYRRFRALPADWKGYLPDHYDEVGNSQTFGIFVGGRLSASMRLSVISPERPVGPAMEIFKDEIMERVDQGRVLVDPNRFVTDTSAAAQFPELPYLAMRLPVMACLHFGADECLSMVRPEHMPFYKRVFSAESVAGPILHPTLNMNAMLMVSQVDDLHDDLDRRFPFWRSNYLERRQLFGQPHVVLGKNAHETEAA